MEHRQRRIGLATLAGSPVAPLASELEDTLVALEHEFGGGPADQDQQPGLDQGDRALDERRTDHLFLQRRRPVARRAPEDGVGDKHLVLEVYRGQHPIQQLAGLTDKGFAALIFIGTGAFTNQHDLGIGLAAGEDGLFGAQAA